MRRLQPRPSFPMLDMRRQTKNPAPWHPKAVPFRMSNHGFRLKETLGLQNLIITKYTRHREINFHGNPSSMSGKPLTLVSIWRFQNSSVKNEVISDADMFILQSVLLVQGTQVKVKSQGTGNP